MKTFANSIMKSHILALPLVAAMALLTACGGSFEAPEYVDDQVSTEFSPRIGRGTGVDDVYEALLLGELEAAEIRLAELDEGQRQDPVIRYMEAEILHLKGELSASAERFEALLLDHPDHPPRQRCCLATA